MDLIGIGLYSLPEAAHLLGVESRDVKRWLCGYEFTAGNRGSKPTPRWSPPLWEPQIGQYEGMRAIGFHDLLELRFVREFVKHGLHLSVVRVAAATARELFKVPYPFTTLRFQTDGESIYYDAVKKSKRGDLLDLPRRQLAFDAVIRPSLYKGIEFRNDGSALRWYPLANSRVVVLDPQIAFGKPIVADYGVSTETIVSEYVANKRKKAVVARLFNIPTTAVDAAIKFEQRQAA